MKNENKCFFSISLENGITITGENPNDVKLFLSDLGMCISDALEYNTNCKYQSWKNYLRELKSQVDNAWMTIHENQK